MFADLDGFKPINDVHGHAAGDAVLAAVGAALRDASPPGDLVARYGGDEFVLAARLPRRAAHGVQARLAGMHPIGVTWAGEHLTVTLSVGFALYDASTLCAALQDPSAYAQAEALVDAQMYLAKRILRG